MSGNTRAPEEYSTNPNTMRSRRRKMSLTGAKKVADAARTADYKAMMYARKVCQAKAEYNAASESEKNAMLEQAMRDTMAKRREKGQDTMSKMAAFDAGIYQHRPGATGPKTRVPISAFLEDNGFVPSRPDRKNGNEQANFNSDPFNAHKSNGDPVTPISFASTPEDGMTWASNAFAGASGLPSFHGRVGSASANVFGPSNYLLETPAHHHSNPNLFRSQSPSSGVAKIKASTTPGPLANMTPEPMCPSIEGPEHSFAESDSFSMLQMEVAHLRTICHNLTKPNNGLRDSDPRNAGAEMGIDQNRMADMDRRVGQLEGLMHAMQNTTIPTLVDRVTQLEGLVDELRAKVGSGADGEVSKMREVMGCLREALDRVGGFL